MTIRPVAGFSNRRVCKLANNFRFTLRFECETCMPTVVFLPVIKQDLDINNSVAAGFSRRVIERIAPKVLAKNTFLSENSQ